ncbi:uncharacterized protein [Medicago truncatula]|nr:uncharacterized protein LOC11425977 [Medicago truncatula]
MLFVSRWRSVLASQRYGWIKDPAGNYIRIDLSKIVTENLIPGGLMISRTCGFAEPQRVVLFYQTFDNQFNMRIVDDRGLDIPYFGFHYPINHHVRRVADPSYVSPKSFISVVDSPNDDGEVGLPIPFEMFGEFVAVEDVGHEAGNTVVNGPYQIPENDEPVHIPAVDGEPEEYIWTLKVTQAVADGRSVMHFPRYVIDNFEFSVGNEIDVLDDASGEIVSCRLKTFTKPSGYVMKYLSGGWHQYVRSKELNVGDRILFGVVNPVMDVVFRIHRQ